MAVLIHVLDCCSVGIALVHESGLLRFRHTVDVFYHILRTLECIDLDLLVLLILFQTVHGEVCELLILASFKLVCIGVSSRVLEVGEGRRS